jgi:diguanylate cyclase (GGDEF)-like protein
MPRRLFRSAAIDRNRFVALYVCIAAALLVSAVFFIHDATIILADRRSDDASVAVLEAGNRVLHDLENLETGQRGYLLTAEQSYLQPYWSAVGDLNDAVSQLRELVGNDPQSTALVARIDREKHDKVMEIGRTLDLAGNGKRDAALTLVRTNEGKRYMDALRDDLGVLMSKSREVRRVAVLDVDRRVVLAATALAFIAVLVCCLLVYTLFIQRRAFARVHAYTDVVNRRASLDTLTGLPNRRHLLTTIRALIEDVEAQSHRRVAMLYLDIDGFKAVNDSLGHTAGDALLRALARALRESIREGDLLTRVGGDEFVLIAFDFNDAAQLRDLGTRLAVSVRRVGEQETGGRFAIGVSIGIATYPDTVDSIEGLLDAADAAMYEAKRAGLSSYAFARREANEKVVGFHPR